MNKFLKKGFVLIVLMFFILSACSSNSSQESTDLDENSNYPEDVIEMVIPAGAGGDTDRNGRLLAEYLKNELGVSVVVQNVEGASGSVGTEEVLKSEPDGHRVLFFHNNILINEIMGLTDVNYSDFEIAGISMLDYGSGIITREDSPYEDASDLIEDAKENPGEIDLATNLGSLTYVQVAELSEKTGAEFNLVDAGEFAENNSALLGGHIDVTPMQLGLVKDYFEAEEMKGLGVFADERLNDFPDVPTFKELGIDVVSEKYFVLAFPADTPEDIVEKFSEAVENVSNNDDYIEKAQDYGIIPQFIDAEQTKELLEEDYNRYKDILQDD